jgi:hypothetical protein
MKRRRILIEKMTIEKLRVTQLINHCRNSAESLSSPQALASADSGLAGLKG